MRIALILLMFALTPALDAAELFKGGVTFDPPPGFDAFELNHDPGDNPFSGDGPGIRFLNRGTFGEIQFQISLVGFGIGDGKVITYQKLDPAELRRIMQEQASRRDPKARIEPVTLSGLQGGRIYKETKMAPGAPFETNRVQASWLQIETNIVLKITAVSPDTMVLKTMTDAIAKIKVDKKKLLDSLRPKQPKVVKDQLLSVTSGFIKTNDAVSAAFVFRCKSKTYFFTSDDIRKPEEIVTSIEDAVTKVKKHINDPQVYTHVHLSIARTGSGENDFQRQCNFEFVDRRSLGGATEEDVFKNWRRYFPLHYADEQVGFWVRDLKSSGTPPDFRKFKEYPFNISFFRVEDE